MTCDRCGASATRRGLYAVSSFLVCLACDRVMRREHAEVVAYIAACSGLAAA